MRCCTVVFSFLIAVTAHGQTPPADPAEMAKDPRLQQTVDVHLKRALVPELTTFLKKHTDQHFAMEQRLEPLMVCVFADKQPLWKIMNGVAEVLGARWLDLKSEWKLVFPAESANLLQRYKNDEQAALNNDLYQRAKALADLVSKDPWAIGGSSATGPQEMPDDITPQQWAASCIGQKAFYVAGVMFRDTSLLSLPRAFVLPKQQAKRDCVVPFTENILPQGFMLAAPENDQVRDSEMRVQTDQPGLDGSQIVARSMPWAGTLESILVSDGAQQAQRPKRLVARPLPTGDLAKTRAGKWLVDWQTDLKSAENSILNVRIQQVKTPPSPYRDGLCGIEDYLEALNKGTGETIIADGFRLPIQPTSDLDSGDTVRNWLQTLKTTQKCFVRIDGDVVEVRHGGFWDLREYEPDEQTMRAFESIKAPDLNDYADLAITLNDDATLVAKTNEKFLGEALFPKYIQCEQPLLTRFDFKPLRNNYMGLLAYGQFDATGRKQIMTGRPFNAMLSNDDRTSSILSATVLTKSKSGRLVPTPGYVIDNEGGISFHIEDVYIGLTGAYGPFFGASVTDLEKLMMECYRFPCSYLALSGRCPYSPWDEQARWYGCETQLSAHGYQLSLVSAPFDPANLDDPHKKVLYGSFRFLSGIAKDQGVYQTIDIPEPSHG